jgi:hypothetical protein
MSVGWRAQIGRTFADRRPPRRAQTRLDVFDFESRFEQRIVLQIEFTARRKQHGRAEYGCRAAPRRAINSLDALAERCLSKIAHNRTDWIPIAVMARSRLNRAVLDGSHTMTPPAKNSSFLCRYDFCCWPIATLPQEFMSAMLRKRTNPNRREW